MPESLKKNQRNGQSRPKHSLVDAGRHAKVEDGRTIKSQNQNILFNPPFPANGL